MELIWKYLPGPTPTPSFWFWHHPFPTGDLWCQARKNEACIHLFFMIYNLYFFRKTEIEKSIPLGHLIATLLSSSSLDHILDPVPHTLLHPSIQEAWIRKLAEVQLFPNQSRAAGRQTPGIWKVLYTEDIQLCVWIRQPVYVCLSEGGKGQTVGVGHTVSQPSDTWVDSMFQILEQASKSNRTFWVGKGLNICLGSAGNLPVCTKTQTKGWDECLSSPASHETVSWEFLGKFGWKLANV